MLALLRRDPALRALPRWLIVAALFASVIEGLRTFLTLEAARDGREIETSALLLLALWLPLAVHLAFGGIGARCTRFDMALPVTARRLWLAHLLGVTLSAGAVLATAAGVVRLHDWLVGSLRGNPPVPQPGPIGLAVPLASGMILALTILIGVQPSLQKIRAGRGYALLVLVCATGMAGLTAALVSVAPGWALLPLAVALVLGVRTYRSLPAAFSLVPLTAESGGARSADGDSERSAAFATGGRTGKWRSYWMICRILYKGIAPGQLVKVSVVVWLGFPVIFAWGLFVSGLFYDAEPIRYIYVVLSAYLLFCFVAGPMAQLHILDPLPVSRRALFFCLTVPLLALLSIGYGAGRLGMAVFKDPVALVEFREDDSYRSPPYREEAPMVRVPVEFFAVAWDGEPPPNGSPWGESHPAWRIPLYRGARAALYSPFSTPAGSSPDFAALQISRAVEAVYGESVSAEEVLRRYLEVDDDRRVRWRDEGASFRERYRQLEPRLRVPVFPVVFTILTLFFLLFTSLYLSGFRATVSDRLRLFVYFGVLAFALMVHIAPIVFLIAGITKDWVLAGLVKILTRRVVEAMPAGSLVIWSVCLLVALGGYWVAQSRFRRIEVPVPRGKQEE
jgi:hypothetical protein